MQLPQNVDLQLSFTLRLGIERRFSSTACFDRQNDARKHTVWLTLPRLPHALLSLQETFHEHSTILMSNVKMSQLMMS